MLHQHRSKLLIIDLGSQFHVNTNHICELEMGLDVATLLVTQFELLANLSKVYYCESLLEQGVLESLDLLDRLDQLSFDHSLIDHQRGRMPSLLIEFTLFKAHG